MLTNLSHTFQDTLLRLSDAPRRAFERVWGRRFSPAGAAPLSSPPPANVTTRLEAMFDALSDLSAQPHVAAAFELACDALQVLLPTDLVGAGLYHIDTDEFRFVTARGLARELLPSAAVARRGCLSDVAHEQAVVLAGAASSCCLGEALADASLLLCPVTCESNLLGVLVLGDTTGAAVFTKHDLELARYVAEQLGSFIHEQRHRSVHAAAKHTPRPALT